MTLSPPTPHPGRDPSVAAERRRIHAEQARCRILLRLVTARIDLLTASATLHGSDTWLALRHVQEGNPPPAGVDLAELLQEACDPAPAWDRLGRLNDLEGALRIYLHSLDVGVRRYAPYH